MRIDQPPPADLILQPVDMPPRDDELAVQLAGASIERSSVRVTVDTPAWRSCFWPISQAEAWVIVTMLENVQNGTWSAVRRVQLSETWRVIRFDEYA